MIRRITMTALAAVATAKLGARWSIDAVRRVVANPTKPS
jgi:hypothetical protein